MRWYLLNDSWNAHQFPWVSMNQDSIYHSLKKSGIHSVML